MNIIGLDDLVVNPKYIQIFSDQWPDDKKDNEELLMYPGAGHFIDPPYSHMSRVINAQRKMKDSIDFLPDEFKGKLGHSRYLENIYFFKSVHVTPYFNRNFKPVATCLIQYITMYHMWNNSHIVSTIGHL